MKKKVISVILGIYFGITLLLFGLEVYFQFGNPLFIIGLDFFIFGLISIKYFTYGYENPEKIFVDMPEKQIKLVKRITTFLSIFATFIILLMLCE